MAPRFTNRIGHLALLLVPALAAGLPAQQPPRSGPSPSRAPDILLSRLTVEGGGATSAAAESTFRAATALAARQQRDSALQAFGSAARLARRDADSVTLADAQYRAGLLLWSSGEYESSIPWLDSARTVRLAIGDDVELARVANTLGASHYQLGLYEPAIDAFELALRLRRRTADTSGLVRTLTNIGKTYHDWEQYEDAHRTLTEAIAIAGNAPERASSLGYALNSRAVVNIDREAYDEAFRDITRSRAEYRRYAAIFSRADTVDAWELNRSAEGLLRLRQGRPRDAITLLEPVLASARQRGSERAQARVLINLGDSFTRMGSPAVARARYEDALAVAQAGKQRALMLAALKRLADTEEAAGNRSEALRLLREYNALWNVIFDQDASLRITTREARAATEAALAANREQQQTIARQRMTLTVIALIVVFVSVLLFVYVRFSNRERSRSLALAAANDELTALNAQLSSALSQVKTLSGLIPICANCKSIRDDAGYWNQVEAYLGKHSDARFSHSICQSCGPELYGEFWPTAETAE